MGAVAEENILGCVESTWKKINEGRGKGERERGEMRRDREDIFSKIVMHRCLNMPAPTMI